VRQQLMSLDEYCAEFDRLVLKLGSFSDAETFSQPLMALLFLVGLHADYRTFVQTILAGDGAITLEMMMSRARSFQEAEGIYHPACKPSASESREEEHDETARAVKLDQVNPATVSRIQQAFASELGLQKSDIEWMKANGCASLRSYMHGGGGGGGGGGSGGYRGGGAAAAAVEEVADTTAAAVVKAMVKVTLGTRHKPRRSGRRVSCGVGPGRDVGSAGARSTRAHGVKCCSRRRREQLASSAAARSRELCDSHKRIPGRTSTSATKRSVRKRSAGGPRR